MRSRYYKILQDALFNKIINDSIDIYGGANTYITDMVREPLSTKDVYKLMEGKTKILTYPQLKKFSNLDTLLVPYDNVIILYLTKERFGHYCCVARRNGKICFFDSYGGDKKPDEQLDFINPQFRLKSDQGYPYLTKLLYEAPEPVEYNEYIYQAKGPSIATCGRHCVCFIKSGLDIDGYNKYINKLSKKYNMNFDELVTYLTSH
jgi:hypothetical protein